MIVALPMTATEVDDRRECRHGDDRRHSRSLGSSWFSSTTSNTYPFGSRKKKRVNGVARNGSIRVAPRACSRSFKPRKLGERETDGDVAAKLFLESRCLELGVLDQVQLDTWFDHEPGGCGRDIAGPSCRAPAQHVLEEMLMFALRHASPE